MSVDFDVVTSGALLIEGDNATPLLAAVLLGKKPKVSQVCRFLIANDADDSTLFAPRFQTQTPRLIVPLNRSAIGHLRLP